MIYQLIAACDVCICVCATDESVSGGGGGGGEVVISCNATEFGCCPDGVTSARGRQHAGCPSQFTHSLITTPAAAAAAAAQLISTYVVTALYRGTDVRGLMVDRLGDPPPKVHPVAFSGQRQGRKTPNRTTTIFVMKTKTKIMLCYITKTTMIAVKKRSW